MTVQYPRQDKPAAICVRCGRVHRGSLEKTAICLRPDPKGMACGGRVTWRADPADWTECPTCSGTGIEAGKECSRCDGAGWELRNRAPGNP
jgi:DnaJ-class molecular chaperone